MCISRCIYPYKSLVSAPTLTALFNRRTSQLTARRSIDQSTIVRGASDRLISTLRHWSSKIREQEMRRVRFTRARLTKNVSCKISNRYPPIGNSTTCPIDQRMILLSGVSAKPEWLTL